MKHGLKVDTPEDRRYFEAITKLLKCLNYLYTEGHTCGKDDEDIYDDIQDCLAQVCRLRELSFGKDIHTLIDLAQRYLEIDGFPEEKEQSDLSSNPHICFENAGYNQAIQDCKLALLKKMDGIEDIIKNCNKTNDVYDLGNNHCITKTNMTTDALIAQAIKDHLTK